MADEATSVAALKEAMHEFVAEREWQPFHSPKNLAMGLAVETAELMEHFLWIDNAESRQVAAEPAQKEAIAEEVADVACYLLAMANVLELDLSAAIRDKLAKNARKYPAETYRGRFRLSEEKKNETGGREIDESP
jgi:NTP pyrophosphatase (non-canonical NTP hydrolase)